MNEKVLILEETLEKNEHLKNADKISKSFDEVRKEKHQLDKCWSKKFTALETKTEAEINKLDTNMKQKSFESETKLQQGQFKLKELLEDNRNKIEELKLKLETEKKSIKVNKVTFKCEECGQIVSSKTDLKVHVRSCHPKHISCDHCEMSFSESWIYEKHLKIHSEAKSYECTECEKKFYLKWRFSQHMKVHSSSKVKHCHYFNNGKTCPFKEVGCKFKHTNSIECRNKNNG